MPIIAKTTGTGTSTQAPPGVHRASCVGVYDLGTQPGLDFGPKRKVMFVWELVDEIMPDGRPYVVKARYNLSLHEKATLRKVLEGWRGRPFTDEELSGFDVLNVLGKPCQVNVVHNVKGYADVSSVLPLGKGMNPIKEIHNELTSFAVDDQDSADWAFPEGMPDWIVTEIKNSAEYKAFQSGEAPAGAGSADKDDDIPF